MSNNLNYDTEIGQAVSNYPTSHIHLTELGLQDLRDCYASRVTIKGTFFWQNRIQKNLFLALEITNAINGMMIMNQYIISNLKQKGFSFSLQDEISESVWSGFPPTLPDTGIAIALPQNSNFQQELEKLVDCIKQLEQEWNNNRQLRDAFWKEYVQKQI